MEAQAVSKKTVKSWIKAAKRLAKESPEPGAAEPAKGGGGGKSPLDVGGLRHEPTSFKRGESVTSTVTVTNRGAEAAKLKLRLYVNEAMADSATVAVRPGQSREASFKWTAQEKNKLNIRGELAD